MSFQSSVGFRYVQGMAGEQAFDTPIVAKPWRLSSQTAVANTFGKAFTASADEAVINGEVSTGVATVGGTGAFAGLLINPKNHALYGTTSGGPLAPSLDLPANSVAQLATKGQWFVSPIVAVAYGDPVYFNQTDGTLTNAAGAGYTLIANAKFVHTTTAAGTTVVDLG